MAGRYRYIAARERRGFNLLCGFWEKDKELLTISGLLARAREIMEEYAETGVFPRVLILDDLAVYGRGITKSVCQLRDVVCDLLEDAHPGRFSEERFSGDFQRGVDVWVYAASEKARLLASGAFSFRIFSGKFSHMRTIHDMSLQFSRMLAGIGIANTSFSFSALCGQPWKEMLDAPGVIPQGWSRVSMDCEGERAVVYLKACGGPGVWRFKTLRFFPDLEEDSLRITSFPLLGELDGPAAKELCQRGAKLAREENLPGIARLLEEEHRYLQPLKAQLLVFLVSVLDFQDFRDDILSGEDRSAMLDQVRCDLPKIVRNFGGGNTLMRELVRMVFDRALHLRLRWIVEPALVQWERPLLPGQPKDYAELNVPLENSYHGDACMDIVARYIWEMGIKDEKEAVKVADRPYWFEPLGYQEGGNSLRRILKDLATRTPDPRTVCGLIAALIITMDRGLEGPTASAEEDGGMQLRMKVGELSTFYQVRKYAAWLPALARVEEFYYLLYRTKQEATAAFLAWCGAYDEDLMKVYECGQTFTDWNFANLVRSGSSPEEAAAHRAEAERFLTMTEDGMEDDEQ